MTLAYVPSEERTYSLCHMAARADPRALRYVPSSIRSVIEHEIEQEKGNEIEHESAKPKESSSEPQYAGT